MYLGFFVGPVCNFSVSVQDGDLLLVRSSSSGDSDSLQEAGNDRNNFGQSTRFPVSDFVSTIAPFIRLNEGIVVLTPLCSFFLSDTFYVFLNSLAP